MEVKNKQYSQALRQVLEGTFVSTDTCGKNQAQPTPYIFSSISINKRQTITMFRCGFSCNYAIDYLYVSCIKMLNTLLSANVFFSLTSPPTFHFFPQTYLLPQFSYPSYLLMLTFLHLCLSPYCWHSHCTLSPLLGKCFPPSLPQHTSYSIRYSYKKTVQSNHRDKSQPPLFKQEHSPIFLMNTEDNTTTQPPLPLSKITPQVESKKKVK